MISDLLLTSPATPIPTPHILPMVGFLWESLITIFATLVIMLSNHFSISVGTSTSEMN